MTNEQQNKQIFLCMGNTGTEKSTFIRSMGGAVDPKELVASEESLTTRTMFYPAGPTATVLLVDTPGFGDSRSSDDPNVFSDSKHRAEILGAFKDQELTHFNGVYWFVNDPRVTKELEDQARYINDLVNPETEGSKAKRSTGWLHVVVMLRGTTTDGLAVQSVVKKVTGSAEWSEKLCLKNIGLSLNGGNPGDCDLKIEGTTVRNSRGRDISELHKSSMSKVLGWFRATHPIKWTKTHGKCLDCLQEGDPRAFGRCHKSIRRIHREKARHAEIQVLTHGPRDMKERTKSILKKVAVGLSAAGFATGTAMTAAITILAPNPGTAIAAGTLLHMTIAVAAITAGAAAVDSASAHFGQTIVDPRDLTEMITSGQLDVTAEELKELENTLKGYTRRGKCSKCKGMADKNPCIYLWSCCKRAFLLKDENSHSPFHGGCTAFCTKCEKVLLQDDEKQGPDHKIDVPGCLNQCSDCGATEDDKDFRNNGCGTASHDLVYLSNYDEVC